MLTSHLIKSILTVDTKRVFIAYSGGVDSHALLHMMSLNTSIKANITAVYVNHGLQAEAVEWAEHCAKVALNLGVAFKCLNVNAQRVARESQEEVARNARYQALKSLLEEGDVLLLAQHREDQMETVMLQLFRGAGVQGLSGMPVKCAFGAGQMCRPLLDVSQQEINDYAQQYNLDWVEDSSNQCDDFDRNFLRNQVFPQLKKRWPALDKTVSRSARHCAASDSLAKSVVKVLFEQLYDLGDETLDITELLKLEMLKQQLVVRQWFNVLQLRMPAEKTVQRIINEVANAQVSASPQVQGRGYRVRRYRNKLFCLKNDISTDIPLQMEWVNGLKKINYANYHLAIVDSTIGLSKVIWDKSEVVIKFRTGSEKIKLPGRVGHHTLKKLFQEQGVPPWQRGVIPLIYLDNDLAAVGNLWISVDFFSDQNEECYQILWKQEKNARIGG